MKKQTLIGLNIAVLAVVGCSSLALVSNAQAPKEESMEQKVVRLEKEVTRLREEIAALRQVRSVGTWTPNYPKGQTSQKRPGKPLSFNGQTYYLMPLGRTGNTAVSTTKLPPSAVTRLAQPRK